MQCRIISKDLPVREDGSASDLSKAEMALCLPLERSSPLCAPGTANPSLHLALPIREDGPDPHQVDYPLACPSKAAVLRRRNMRRCDVVCSGLSGDMHDDDVTPARAMWRWNVASYSKILRSKPATAVTQTGHISM